MIHTRRYINKAKYMDGLNKMCVFSAVIKPTLGNIIRRG